MKAAHLNIVLPNHTPEINHSTAQRALGGDIHPVSSSLVRKNRFKILLLFHTSTMLLKISGKNCTTKPLILKVLRLFWSHIILPVTQKKCIMPLIRS